MPLLARSAPTVRFASSVTLYVPYGRSTVLSMPGISCVGSTAVQPPGVPNVPSVPFHRIAFAYRNVSIRWFARTCASDRSES